MITLDGVFIGMTNLTKHYMELGSHGLQYFTEDFTGDYTAHFIALLPVVTTTYTVHTGTGCAIFGVPFLGRK